MTELKVDTVVNLAGTGKPNFENGITVNSAATSTLNLNEYTESSSEPSSPSNGALWWDTANEKTFIYAEGQWRETVGVSAEIVNGGTRGFAFGGDYTNVIEYVDIQTAGNATDFGDMQSTGEGKPAGVSSKTRGVMSGNGNWMENYEYITCATAGNATNFGSTYQNDQKGPAFVSDGSRGVLVSGITDYENSNHMEYITIDTTGNGTNFGNQTVTSTDRAGCADSTRGVIFAGQNTNVIDYITIQTTGNATDFGDCIYSGIRHSGATADATTGFHIAGADSSMQGEIHYVTIQTTGNAADWGDLSVAAYGCDASSDGTYVCVFFSQANTGSISNANNIERFSTASAGNASDFGDMTVSNVSRGSLSGNAS